MRTIPDVEAGARRLQDLLTELGRLQSLRDPLAIAVESLALTPAQVHAVMWLGREQALTMGELARRVGVTDKTCTGLVDRLEEKGFVERVRDDEDRRVVRVRLTTRGTGTFAELDAEVFRKFTGFLALLGEDDRQSLFRILENLLQTLLERAASR